MREKLLLLMLCLLVPATGAVAAGKQGPPQNNRPPDTLEMSFEDPSATMVRLTHFIDLWHDANLKGDMSLVAQREMEIMQILRSDLVATHNYLQKCEKELWALEVESERNKSAADQSRFNRRLTVKKQVEKVRDWLGVKKHLAASLTHTNAFSNKYRLLGDYVDILERQTDVSRMAMSGDTGDPAHEDMRASDK